MTRACERQVGGPSGGLGTVRPAPRGSPRTHRPRGDTGRFDTSEIAAYSAAAPIGRSGDPLGLTLGERGVTLPDPAFNGGWRATVRRGSGTPAGSRSSRSYAAWTEPGCAANAAP
jgi:hypothetical protein